MDSLIHMQKDFTPEKDPARLFEEQLIFHTIKRSQFEPKACLFKTLFVPFNLQSTRQIICFTLKYILGVYFLNGIGLSEIYIYKII